MKHIETTLIIFLLVFFACTACTNKAPTSQTTEASNPDKSQATQQTQVPTTSPSITEEPQHNFNKDKAITKSEILSFFNSDNEFATNMLQYPAKDMNNLKAVIEMIIYPAGATYNDPISFDNFNEYTMKYINKSYADSAFAKFATDENVAGTNVIMSKRVLYVTGIGDIDILIKDVEVTGSDSALITCYRGLNRDEPDTMKEVSFNVQFGRANSQLYLISIAKIAST